MSFRVDLENPELMEAQVARCLRERIASSAFEGGRPLPSLKELAAMFSVSRATVQKAVGLLKKEKLVVTRAGKGTFVRSVRPDAGKLAVNAGKARNRTYNLAAVRFDVWGGLDDYVIPLTEAINAECCRGKYNFQLNCVRGTTLESSENRLLHGLIYNRDIDGVIILSPIDSRDLRGLRRRRIPFVLVSPAVYKFPVNTVKTDSLATVRMFVEASLERGRRRLAMVTGPRAKSMDWVKMGAESFNKHFRMVLKEKKFPVTLAISSRAPIRRRQGTAGCANC